MRFTPFVVLAAVVLETSAPIMVHAADERYSRIVAIGGSVTEIVYALGEERRLVGRDSTSIYPPEALKLPDAGYIRALSPEGVLSLNPDLILALDGAGPPEALATLEAARVPFVTIPEGHDQTAIPRKVEAVGAALGVQHKAHELATKLTSALDHAIEDAARTERKARVLFVLSIQNGRVMAAGNGNNADGIVRLAGAENVLSGINGYKQVSDEAVITAAPDVIVMMNSVGSHSPDDEAVLSHPAIAATPAGKEKRLIRMDGMYLLGFGPRTAEAITSLHAALYPDARKPE